MGKSIWIWKKTSLEKRRKLKTRISNPSSSYLFPLCFQLRRTMSLPDYFLTSRFFIARLFSDFSIFPLKQRDLEGAPWLSSPSQSSFWRPQIRRLELSSAVYLLPDSVVLLKAKVLQGVSIMGEAQRMLLCVFPQDGILHISSATMSE